jgi:GAF domain-containing protein/DNA-binding CsgD family transcriptional regulator
MAVEIGELSDSSRLLFDLQKANSIAQSFSACLEPEIISRKTAKGLVELFHSTFARIWLVEPDGANLKLVASSGLYDRIDGSFARVPMGAYKVGKIAHNRVSFLSNNLAEETWVKDRAWAIANQIRGFAGFPLIAGDRVIGVLATFSHGALTPEFLEVLQVLCTTVANALDAAIQYQQKFNQLDNSSSNVWGKSPLSDQIAAILKPVRLTLIGTEEPIGLSQSQVFLQVSDVLSRVECRQCRLTYQKEGIVLEATAVIPSLDLQEQERWLRSQLGLVSLMVSYLGGQLESQIGLEQKVLQLLISLPYNHNKTAPSLQDQSGLPVLPNPLSEREREILGFLVQGLRDRDIANHLIISESTVKFHLNNVLTKLKARTRYQALYEATIQGWIV